MYISVRMLRDQLGVDERLARFFVDRKVPKENSFWDHKHLYLNRGNGFLSIPLYYDLLYRIGISREWLLEEKHIQFMEQIMHWAILAEMQKISFAIQLDRLNQLLEGRTRNPLFHADLLAYLQQPKRKPMGLLGREIPALNRADVFLFVLCDLPLQPAETEKAIRYWYALHTTYLILDDLYDYESDKKEGEENALLEWGDGKAAVDKALSNLTDNIRVLEEINPKLSRHYTFLVETMPIPAR